MNYIVFYNYDNGTRDFGYYADYEEANQRYRAALKEDQKLKLGLLKS